MTSRQSHVPLLMFWCFIAQCSWYIKCSFKESVRVSIVDMLKFSSFVYHYHHPPDAYNAKLLFNHFLRRGREFLEKVKNGWSHGTAVPEVLTLPRVTPPVVCTTSRSAVYWQKSSAAWKNLVSNYLARNHSEGFATKFAKGCRSRCVFGSWREANNYGGLARKVAMFGFVGVAVSANGKPQYLSFENAGSDNIYSAIRVCPLWLFYASLLQSWGHI